VDDLNARAAEENLAALDAHPDVEVRLFNPFSRSFWPGLTRMLDFMVHPVRLNHRAHNKSFSADGAVAIVGGRNIGDAYFNANPEVNFADLDLLAIGPAARQVGVGFDSYWQSELAVPMGAWRSLRRDPDDLDALRPARELRQALRRVVRRAASDRGQL
jgi:putative cardiolipin synthase